jgi:thymidylate synthase (FAD)
MRVVEQCVIPLYMRNYKDALHLIEEAGRTCYKSEDAITSESSVAFVKMLIKAKHFSVLEHVSITVKLITNRGVSHELVRHRIASYSQESTRYCNYSKDKFKNELSFIYPNALHFDADQKRIWIRACENAERDYLELLELGATPQAARDVLPNALKTEVVITANLREWRQIFEQRLAPAAHPQMVESMRIVAKTFDLFGYGIFFEDIWEKYKYKHEVI